MAEFYVAVDMIKFNVAVDIYVHAWRLIRQASSENVTENRKLKLPEISAGHACVELISWSASNTIT